MTACGWKWERGSGEGAEGNVLGTMEIGLSAPGTAGLVWPRNLQECNPTSLQVVNQYYLKDIITGCA